MNYVVAQANTQSLNAVTLRMGRLSRLSLRETEVLQDLPQSARHYPVNTELCVEGHVQSPHMLLSGWACCQRIFGDGRRQILQFIIPGDAIGSLAWPTLPAVCTTVALTPVVMADAHPLLRLSDEGGVPLASISGAIAKMSHAHETNLRDQVMRLGRQTAYERLIDLVLELYRRLQGIGMVDGNSFLMPLTQEILADALGLSAVHVNRTLQQIRQDKLLEVRNGRVTLLQMDRIRAGANSADPMGRSAAFEMRNRA